VFEQKGVQPTTRTLNDLVTAYASDLRQVDFASPQATDEINAVIAHDTHGLIPRLFDQPLTADTQTVLADAIFLDANWRDPFPSSAPGTFHTGNGTTVTTPMMDNSGGDYASRMADGWQSVVLPYTGSLQAVALLPPAGSAACATPSAATMSALSTGPAATVGVVLPKLSLSQSMSLTDILSAMGLPLDGDFSGLGAGDSQISQVEQKVVMKVDEKGTKAAAATGVTMTMSLRVANQVVNFDRPFLMVIEDTTTHTPLFVAKVADPTRS
jgi:serpin B